MTASGSPPAPGSAPAPVSGAAPAWRFERRDGVDVLTWPALAAAGIEVVVTAREGGVSTGPYASLNLGLHVGDDPAAVLENRRRALATVDAGLDDAVFCVQSHGRAVHVATAADRGRGTRSQADAVPDTDALVTRDPGTVLVVMVADCVPVVLADPVAGVAAAVHAGWRGTVARVCEAAVTAMAGLGARPERIVAGLGPAVAPDRYEVGPEVAEAAARRLGTGDGPPGDVIRPSGQGRWLFDLWAANARVLRESGVRESAIQVARVPTGHPPVTDGALADGTGPRDVPGFFSDRQARPCGRFALLVRLPQA